jgi:hypothetical protein
VEKSQPSLCHHFIEKAACQQHFCPAPPFWPPFRQAGYFAQNGIFCPETRLTKAAFSERREKRRFLAEKKKYNR